MDTPTRVQAKRGKKKEATSGTADTEEALKTPGGKRKKNEVEEEAEDALKEDAVGRKVKKSFKKVPFTGEVKEYHPEEKPPLYSVRETLIFSSHRLASPSHSHRFDLPNLFYIQLFCMHVRLGV